MAKTIPRKKKLLLLVNDVSAFEASKTLFEMKKFEVFEDFESADEFDLVLLDSFFALSGMAEFLKKENPLLPVVLLSYGPANMKPQDAKHIYDEVGIPHFGIRQAGAWLASWLETAKAQFLFEQFPKEFGSGLWVDVVQKIMPIMGTAESNQRQYA